ncbi:proteasome protein [Halobacteriales archaeon SW_5_68_122]|nr:MAG: proteasome protein [Halobacteriales archaeon SW_5_68_122]
MGLLGSLTPSLFRSGEILGIADDALQFALQASEDTHPDEYMGQLRGEDARKLGLDRDGTVITDVLIAPGTNLATFSRGDVHIIVGAPYGRDDWQAFDTEGEPTELDVLDVELSDEGFFDFTQEDIDRELR